MSLTNKEIKYFEEQLPEGSKVVSLIQGGIEMYSAWDFVERFYPNYSSCDTILHEDKLNMIVNGEWENSEMATEIVEQHKKSLKTNDMKIIQSTIEIKLYCLRESIYSKAIEGFINHLKGGEQ